MKNSFRSILLPLAAGLASLTLPFITTALVGLGTSALYAQTIVSGDIAGTVKDPSGALVP